MTTSQLDRIEAKLDRLQAALDQAGPLLDVLPGAIATVGNTVDDLARRDGPGQLDQRLRRAGAVLTKLSDPALLGAIERLLDHRDALIQLADLATQIPAFVAVAGDSFDDLVARGRERGIDPEVMLRALFDSRMLESRQVELLAEIAHELPNAVDAPSEDIGLLKLYRVLREDEVQRALSFLIHFARRLGRVLDDQDRQAPPALPAK